MTIKKHDLFKYRNEVHRAMEISETHINSRIPIAECTPLPHKYHFGDLVVRADNTLDTVDAVFVDGDNFVYSLENELNPVKQSEIKTRLCK